jgi:hypothetical protein
VHAIDHVAALRAARDVGLIGDDHQPEAGVAQAAERLGHAGSISSSASVAADTAAVADDGPVDYAVPVEEDGRRTPRSIPISSAPP